MSYPKRNHIVDLAEDLRPLHDGQTVAEWIAEHIPTTRVRRGKVVTIPPEWRGAVTHPQTIRKRDSKRPRKDRMLKERFGVWGKKSGHPRTWAPRHTPDSIREALAGTED